MRIIAGEFRSRRLIAPAGEKTRPTSDRLRETLFNVLQARVAGAQFADLYAGSGAVGFEAISRGAAHVYFAESAKGAARAIAANALALGLTEGRQYTLDARGTEPLLRELAAAGVQLNLVFLDPPYEQAREYMHSLELLARLPLLAAGSVVVAEHTRRRVLPEQVDELRRYRLLEQGDAALSFYSLASG